MAWTVLTGSVEVLHGFMLFEVVHLVPVSVFLRNLFILKLMHETVLGFLERICLVVKFNTVYFVSTPTGVLVYSRSLIL